MSTVPSAASAAGTQAVLEGNPRRNDLASQPYYLLPKDLAGALKRLSDEEVDALLAAATVEAKRRDRPQQRQTSEAAIDAKAPARRLHVQDAGTLATGKLNAVRAAFNAGVKPSAIARQFGISKSDVGRVLAEGRSRKSRR
jgi:hypothetical protein